MSSGSAAGQNAPGWLFYIFRIPMRGDFLGPLICLLTQCQIIWLMKSSRVITASDCQCQSRNSPGFDPSILRHSGVRGAADEAVLNKVHRK